MHSRFVSELDVDNHPGYSVGRNKITVDAIFLALLSAPWLVRSTAEPRNSARRGGSPGDNSTPWGLIARVAKQREHFFVMNSWPLLTGLDSS
jgi:hypothetical protein